MKNNRFLILLLFCVLLLTVTGCQDKCPEGVPCPTTYMSLVQTVGVATSVEFTGDTCVVAFVEPSDQFGYKRDWRYTPRTVPKGDEIFCEQLAEGTPFVIIVTRAMPNKLGTLEDIAGPVDSIPTKRVAEYTPPQEPDYKSKPPKGNEDKTTNGDKKNKSKDSTPEETKGCWSYLDPTIWQVYWTVTVSCEPILGACVYWWEDASECPDCNRGKWD